MLFVIKNNCSKSKFTENYFLNKWTSRKEKNPHTLKAKAGKLKNLQALENVILQLCLSCPVLVGFVRTWWRKDRDDAGGGLRKRIIIITLDLHALVIGV